MGAGGRSYLFIQAPYSPARRHSPPGRRRGPAARIRGSIAWRFSGGRVNVSREKRASYAETASDRVVPGGPLRRRCAVAI